MKQTFAIFSIISLFCAINPAYAQSFPPITLKGRTKTETFTSEMMKAFCDKGMMFKSFSTSGGGMEYIFRGAAIKGPEFTFDNYRQIQSYFKKYCPQGW